MILRWHFWVYSEKNDQRKKSYKKTIECCIFGDKEKIWVSHTEGGRMCHKAEYKLAKGLCQGHTKSREDKVGTLILT